MHKVTVYIPIHIHCLSHGLSNVAFKLWLKQANAYKQTNFWLCLSFRLTCVIKWKHFPRYWPFVRGIHRSTVNSPHKGQWRGALMFSLICAWINGWVNNHETGDLRRHRPHYDVTIMYTSNTPRIRHRVCSLLCFGFVEFRFQWNYPQLSGLFH